MESNILNSLKTHSYQSMSILFPRVIHHMFYVYYLTKCVYMALEIALYKIIYLILFCTIFKYDRRFPNFSFSGCSVKVFAPPEKQTSAMDSPRQGQYFDTILPYGGESRNYSVNLVFNHRKHISSHIFYPIFPKFLQEAPNTIVNHA